MFPAFAVLQEVTEREVRLIHLFELDPKHFRVVVWAWDPLGPVEEGFELLNILWSSLVHISTEHTEHPSSEPFLLLTSLGWQDHWLELVWQLGEVELAW